MQFGRPTNFAERRRLYKLGQPEAATLARLWPVLEPAVERGLHAFVAAERLMPTVAKSFEAHGPFIHRTERRISRSSFPAVSTKLMRSPAKTSAASNATSA